MTEEEARRRVILAMCPNRVCRVCGEPSRRIQGDVEYVNPRKDAPPVLHFREGTRQAERANQWGGVAGKDSLVRTAPTLGFTDCGHDDWRPGVWLDPFNPEAT